MHSTPINARDMERSYINYYLSLNPLKFNDLKKSRAAQLTSSRYILYIYSTNIRTEYFKHAA